MGKDKPPGRGSEGEGTGEEADEEDISDEDKEEETVSRDKMKRLGDPSIFKQVIFEDVALGST